MTDGNISFETVEGLEEFEQRILNSLNLYSVETFWDSRKGVNFSVIASRQNDYKLEHMRNKLIEWFGDEATFSKIKDKSKKNSVLYGTVEYTHKIYGQSEVFISG